MSESISQAADAPDGASAPSAAETETTAPVETGAATDHDHDDNQDESDERKEIGRASKRIGQLMKKLSVSQQEAEQLRRQIQHIQARPNGEPGQQLDEAAVQRLRAQWDAEQATKVWQERRDAFHEQGARQYRDWQERCDSLMAMGADDEIANVLLEMEHGTRVVAALADDPEEIERIAAIKSARGRAVALGQYAEKLKAKAEPQRGVSRAPAPIRPVTGRAAPQFNEYAADTQSLVDYYMKQGQEQARSRSR